MTKTTTGRLPLIAALALSAACMDTAAVKNFNSESVDGLIENPTPAGIVTATQGLMVAARANMVGVFGYIAEYAFKGRETYTLDLATPGHVPESLLGPLRPEARNFWSEGYRGIKQGQAIIKALESVAGITDAQKAGVRGFAKTLQAYMLWKVIAAHDASGAVIEVAPEISSATKPIVSRDEVYTYISSLLDEAQTELGNAGATFMFRLSPGFAGFDTPVTFVRVNRALKARIEVYRGSFAGMPAGTANYNAALTAITASFISMTTTTAALNIGAFHTFTTNSGDVSNSLFDAAGTPAQPRVFFAHPSYETDAQLRADGVTRDLRYVTKIFKAATPRTQSNVTSDLGLRVYNSNTASIPIIRNEDLILLRAEANLALGNRAAALADINHIRTVSGSLAAIADPGDPGLMNELVYNRRYSLLQEGHRWWDMRRWGRLADLPRDQPTHRIFSRLPIPLSECDARADNRPAGCDPDNGI